MSAKVKVLLAVPDLQDLGVQHDVRCLMRHWDRDRFEPVMLLHQRVGNFADQFPPEFRSIEVDDQIFSPPRGRVLSRVVGYARVFRDFQPDAVISFVPYPNLACAAARLLSGQRFGLAVSEHAHVTASMRDREAFRGGFLSLYRRVFPWVYNQHADIVKCIAEESRQDLVENHGIRIEKTRLIHNPVEFEEVRALGREVPDHPWFSLAERGRVPLIVCVGRLAHQKRQDLLLRALALLIQKRPARVALIGRGPWQAGLEQLAHELGVADRVVFLGFQRNPWKFMANASLLAVSSDWEGLPCVLTEAMVLGVPIVSTRCPSGPSEMLLDGEAGLLCPPGDPQALAATLTTALEDPRGCGDRAARATGALARFEPGSVARRYEELALELAKIGRA